MSVIFYLAQYLSSASMFNVLTENPHSNQQVIIFRDFPRDQFFQLQMRLNNFNFFNFISF